jgi:hypothetical protein
MRTELERFRVDIQERPVGRLGVRCLARRVRKGAVLKITQMLFLSFERKICAQEAK